MATPVHIFEPSVITFNINDYNAIRCSKYNPVNFYEFVEGFAVYLNKASDQSFKLLTYWYV